MILINLSRILFDTLYRFIGFLLYKNAHYMLFVTLKTLKV